MPQGPQGYQGNQGNQGSIGSQGPQGDQGAQGAQGSQGDIGVVLIPLTYPVDIVNPVGVGFATTTTTYNVPANTLVNVGDIIEFEMDFYSSTFVNPIPNNGTGIVEYDALSMTLNATGGGAWVFGGIETNSLNKIKISITRTGANTTLVDYEAYSQYYSGTLLLQDSAVGVNFAAPIPIVINVFVTINPASTINPSPHGQISRAIMKYFAA